MFYEAEAFNQPLDKWRLNNNVNIYKMLDGALAFTYNPPQQGQKEDMYLPEKLNYDPQ